MEILIIIIILSQKNMENIIQQSQQYVIRRRDDRQRLDRIAPNAKHIRIIGRTLQQVLMNYSEYFLERLKDRGKVELLFTHYELYQYMLAEHGTDHLSDLSSALSSIISIKDRMEKNRYKGQLEIRFIKYVPSLSFVAIDMDKRNGILIVEPVPPYLAPAQRPNILLNPNSPIREEQDLFKDFKKVINDMWKNAEPIHDVKSFKKELDIWRGRI